MKKSQRTGDADNKLWLVSEPESPMEWSTIYAFSFDVRAFSNGPNTVEGQQRSEWKRVNWCVISFDHF